MTRAVDTEAIEPIAKNEGGARFARVGDALVPADRAVMHFVRHQARVKRVPRTIRWQRNTRWRSSGGGGAGSDGARFARIGDALVPADRAIMRFVWYRAHVKRVPRTIRWHKTIKWQTRCGGGGGGGGVRVTAPSGLVASPEDFQLRGLPSTTPRKSSLVVGGGGGVRNGGGATLKTLAFCTLVLLLSACSTSKSQKSEKKTTEKTNAPTSPVNPSRTVTPTRIDFEAMGTRFRYEVFIKGDAHAEANKDLRRARTLTELLENKLSEWRDGEGDVARINQGAGKWVSVDVDTFRVLETALDVAARSEGAYDPTWAALHGVYDFRPGFERFPDAAVIKKRLRAVDYRKLLIAQDAGGQRAKLIRAGAKVGTGSVAKGYALDRVASLLAQKGYASFLLQAGGQILARGQRVEAGTARPFRIGLQHPRKRDVFGSLIVKNASVSTSGDYERAYKDTRGVARHHIIDLKTGLSAQASIAVTVVAQSGAYADALSTAVFVLGSEKGLALLENIRPRAGAVIVDGVCKVHVSDNIREQVSLHEGVVAGAVLPGCMPLEEWAGLLPAQSPP